MKIISNYEYQQSHRRINYRCPSVDVDRAELAECAGCSPRLRVRPLVGQAAANGSFTGNVTPELHITIDGIEARYVVYEGAYYRWNLTVSEETTFARIQMAPVSATALLETVSSPYEAASPKVQSAIKSRSTTGWNVERGVYRRGEMYYAVALGLLAYRYRNPLTDRPLTVRRSLVVATLAVPVALLGTLLFESRYLSWFITGPVSALVVASGMVAGVRVRQRRCAVSLGFTGLVAGLAVGASVLILGMIGGLPGGLAVLVGGITEVIPLGYGIAFGSPRP